MSKKIALLNNWQNCCLCCSRVLSHTHIFCEIAVCNKLRCFCCCSALRYTIGQIVKKPAIYKTQKICEIDYWLYMPATFWQILSRKLIAGNGNFTFVNWLKSPWKNSWNHIKWIYFWRVLVIWNHYVTVLDCCLVLPHHTQWLLFGIFVQKLFEINSQL